MLINLLINLTEYMMDIKQFHRLINYIINNNKILYSTRFTFLPFQIGEREREKK